MKTFRIAMVALGLVGSACGFKPIDLDAAEPLAQRSRIHAADGTLLARIYQENRALVRFGAIPQVLIDAVLAAEDDRFFEHGGYDLRSILRAAIVNAREGEYVQGGSTITQQYVKNTFFTDPPKTLERKARELRLAIELERLYTKEQILERYLNTVYFGGGAYGVKAAAQTFFGHGLESLSLREAALLAGVIRSPSAYDPRDNPERALARRNLVLSRMVETGAIPERRARKVGRKGLGVPKDPPRATTRQPYFVEAARRELLGDRRLGRTGDDRAHTLYKGGVTVTTTLEPDLQRAAEDAVRGVLNQPGDPEAALVAIRPKSGEIVAMVGGRSWKASQVNLALGTRGGGSGRQPGSSFKPLALAAALESGFHLDDKFESSPATFTLTGGETWTVRNAEGGGYGDLPLGEALVRSVNGVYARLAMQLGGGAIASQAKQMGVRSKLSTYPSIVLGSMEVSVLDMAAAYATLANDGTAVRPTTIKSIRFPDGRLLESEPRVTQDVVSPGNAYLVTKVMQDVVKRGTGQAANIGRPAAGKTGTTNDYGDAWFVGFTPDLVAAVWVGYPKGRIPMTNVHGGRVYGGTLPAQIWRAFMLEAHEGVPVREFEIPERDLVTVEIDRKSGLLAAPWCPGKFKRMLRQLAPTEHCPEPPPEPTPSPTPTLEPTPTPSPKASPAPSPSPEGSPTPED
ncbi:MAG TPA: PBP1A family penicillin-binding protein [Actinomycetota bacterium]|nr:PBP1A family penicillin-binding protein [Actinomycetota bacterium]